MLDLVVSLICQLKQLKLLLDVRSVGAHEEAQYPLTIHQQDWGANVLQLHGIP